MPEAPAAVFLIFLHIVNSFTGTSYFVQPAETKYQGSYTSKAFCDEAAKPLARLMKSQSTPPGISFKGVVCKRLEIVK